MHCSYKTCIFHIPVLYMNPLGQVPTVKFIGEGLSYTSEPSMAIPRPVEGLHGISPPPFLTKTYNLVDDPNTNHIVAWSKGNNSFIVWDPEAFSIQLLPKYFKHSNLSSFIRQLNTYVSTIIYVSRIKI